MNEQGPRTESRRTVRVEVKRATTSTHVELRARQGLRLGARLFWRSLIALLRGRRVRLELRRAGASGDAVTLATDIAVESVAAEAGADVSAGRRDPNP